MIYSEQGKHTACGSLCCVMESSGSDRVEEEQRFLTNSMAEDGRRCVEFVLWVGGSAVGFADLPHQFTGIILHRDIHRRQGMQCTMGAQSENQGRGKTRSCK